MWGIGSCAPVSGGGYLWHGVPINARRDEKKRPEHGTPWKRIRAENMRFVTLAAPTTGLDFVSLGDDDLWPWSDSDGALGF